MTVATDLRRQYATRRRWFIKIDGLEPILWQETGDSAPSWTRSGLVCLQLPDSEFTTGIDLKSLRFELSQLTFKLTDIKDSDRDSYFGKIFSPARWDDNPHWRVNVAQDYNETISPTNTTALATGTGGFTNIHIHYADGSDLPNNFGNAYIGQTMINYYNVIDNVFVNCAMGIFSAHGEHFSPTYPQPKEGTFGDQMFISSVPFTFHGKRIFLYLVTEDPSTGTWVTEGNEELFWCGRISDTIQYSPAEQAWILSCTSIIDELQREIGVDFPEAELRGINLTGEGGRRFEIRHWGKSGEYCGGTNIQVNPELWLDESARWKWKKGINPSQYLAKNIEERMQPWEWSATSGGDVGQRIRWVKLYYRRDDNRYEFHIDRNHEDTVRFQLYNPPDCHSLRALGFNQKQYVRWLNSGHAKIKADEDYYESYHPLGLPYNGANVFVDNANVFWDDQGTDESEPGAFCLIDGAVTGKYKESSAEDGKYYIKYTGINKENAFLKLTAAADDAIMGKLSMDSFVGRQHGKDAVTVKQCYYTDPELYNGMTRGPFELTLFPLMSTGTNNYNGEYDRLPLSLSVGIQQNIIDINSFIEADAHVGQFGLSDRSKYYIDEPISAYDMILRESILYGYAPVWSKGKISLVDFLMSDPNRFYITIDDSVMIDNPVPTMSMSFENLVNEYRMNVDYDPITGEYGKEVIVEDVDSKQGYGYTGTIEHEHPGVSRSIKDKVSLGALISVLMKKRDLRHPLPIVECSVPPEYTNRIPVGSMVKFQTTQLPDLLGSGNMDVDVHALVLSSSQGFRTGIIKLKLWLMGKYSKYGNPWAAAALVDANATNSGWNPVTKVLNLKHHFFGKDDDDHDGNVFKTGDKVDIVLCDSNTPEDPPNWELLTVAKDYGTDGSGALTLGAGTTIAGWEDYLNSEAYVVFSNHEDVTADQKTRGVWNTNVSTEKLADGTRGYRLG